MPETSWSIESAMVAREELRSWLLEVFKLGQGKKSLVKLAAVISLSGSSAGIQSCLEGDLMRTAVKNLFESASTKSQETVRLP